MRSLLSASLRWTTLWCLVLFILADGVTLATDTRWVGELGWTPEWANAGLYLGGCLFAGVAGFLSISYFGSSFLAVTGANTVTSRSRVVLSVWGRNLLLGLAGHLFVIVVAIILTLMTAPTDELRWQPFVYSLLPLLVYVSLGTLTSALVPNIVGSALSIVLAYLISFNVAAGQLSAPLLAGGNETTLVGMGYRADALAIWSLTAVGMSLVLLVGTVATLMMRSTTRAILVAFGALLVAFISPTLLVSHLPYRLAPTNHPIAYHCAGAAPVVCVAAGHTRHLTELAHDVDRVARVLRSAGIDLTGETFSEESVVPDRTREPFLNLDPSGLNEDAFSSEELAAAFSRPTECEVYSESDPTASQSLLDVGAALTEWVSQRVKPAQDPSTAALLPDDWARAAYAGLRGCSTPKSVLRAIGPAR